MRVLLAALLAGGLSRGLGCRLRGRVNELVGFDAQEFEFFDGVAFAEFPVAGGRKVEAIAAAGAFGGGDAVGGGDGLVDLVDDGIHAGAGAVLIGVDEFADEERRVLGLEVEVFEQVFVDAFDLGGPFLVTGVGFALVEEDTLDDAVLLGKLAHIDKVLVGIVVVLAADVFDERFGLRKGGEVILVSLFLEEFDTSPGDGNVYDADADVLGEVGFEGAAEVISGADAGVLAAEGGVGGIPLPFFALQARGIDSLEDLEAIICADAVLRLNSRVAFHVGLAEAKIDVEVGIGLVGGEGFGAAKRDERHDKDGEPFEFHRVSSRDTS